MRITPNMLESATDGLNRNLVVWITHGIDKVEEHIKLKRGEQFDVTYDYKALLKWIEAINLKTPMRVRGICEDTLENYFYSVWIDIGAQDECRGAG